MADSISLYLFSLNCARLVQQPAPLTAAFCSTFPSESPELLLFSLQEIAPLADSFLGGTRTIPFIAPFTSAVSAATKQTYDHAYELVAFHSIGLTAILAFARDPASISRIEYGGVGVGLWEMGNKGAVGLRLTINDANITAVAAHLAPDEFQVERRDLDWMNIVRGLVFEENGNADSPDQTVVGTAPSGSKHRQIYSPETQLFVFGDLNYRTSASRPPPSAEFPPANATPADFRELFENDQLTERRTKGKTMHHLDENPVMFKPTYKYLLSNTDTLSPKRFPSWTDRILFTHTPSLSTANYSSIQDYHGSDHKPVFLHAAINAKKGYGSAITPPFEVDKDWKSKRAAARRLEVTVGTLALMVGSPTGWAVITAIIIGGFGGWWAFRALYPLQA